MVLQQKTVTMSDVARHAGVGKITVSRALRTPGKVSPETLKRIKAAVAELGYVLDETAAALSSQRSRTVGALVSTLEQPVFSSTIRGLNEGLRSANLQLLLATTRYQPETEAELIPTLLGRRPEALVLTSSNHTKAARDLLSASDTPTVELWELPESPICAAVGFSNRDAARTITRHLIDTGRRNIAYLCTDRPEDTRAKLRHQGYLDAIATTQQQRALFVPVTADETGADQGAKGFLEIRNRWPDTDAIVCVSDALGLGAWCEAMRQGARVPGDIAITGFGDFDYTGASGIGLTTVHIDGEKIGQTAADLICQSSDGADIRGQRIDIGFSLVRRTTG